MQDQPLRFELFRCRGVLAGQFPRLEALAFGLVLECPLNLVALIIGAQVLDLFFKLRRFLEVGSRAASCRASWVISVVVMVFS